MQRPRPEFDLTNPEVLKRLRDLVKAVSVAGVTNIWQFGSPCSFSVINSPTCLRSFVRRCTSTSRSLRLRVFTLRALFQNLGLAQNAAFPAVRQPTGTRIVPMNMCAWHLGVEKGTPGHFHRKWTWWLVSSGLHPKTRLFLFRAGSCLTPSRGLENLLTFVLARVAQNMGRRSVHGVLSGRPKALAYFFDI